MQKRLHTMPRLRATTTSTTTTTCGACQRSYASRRQLKLHRRRIPLCAEWLGMTPEKRDCRCAAPGVCSDVVEPTDAEEALEWHPSAKNAFAAFATSSTFGSIYGEAATSPVAGFCAPAYALCHIIWNVFVIDKEFTRLPNFAEIVAENRVSCVIAILPDSQLYETLVSPHVPPGTDRGVVEYSGHDVDGPLDVALYDEQCAKIEAHRLRRGNVFVFCNSGYQRSVPFLAYYLTRYHADEVPTVERAIDIILPQLDKANYAALRAETVRNCERALRGT